MTNELVTKIGYIGFIVGLIMLIAIDVADIIRYWGNKMRKAVNHMPTIDAEPVVRCKDCKYYWKNCPTPDVVCLASPKDDAFCSEGERREDETI